MATASAVATFGSSYLPHLKCTGSTATIGVCTPVGSV